MRKIALIFIAAALLFASCRTMKRQIEVKPPVTKDEQKEAEVEARQDYMEGRYQDTIARLKALLKKEPKNSEYWSQLGSAYAQMNELEYAIHAFKQAIKHNPRNIKAMYNLSVVYSEKGNEKAAMDIIKKAIKIDPKNPMLQASLANVLIDEEKYDKAKTVYERIIAAKPEMDVAHYNLGIINYEQRNMDAAQKNYEDVLSLNPDDNEAKANLSAIHILKGDYDPAIEQLKEIIAANPDDDTTLENAYFNLGIAYLRTNKMKEALECFETAIRIEPWDMAAYVNAAIVAEQVGEKEKAVKYWTKYDRLLPVHKRKAEMQKHLKKMGVTLNPTPTPAAGQPEAKSATNNAAAGGNTQDSKKEGKK